MSILKEMNNVADGKEKKQTEAMGRLLSIGLRIMDSDKSQESFTRDINAILDSIKELSQLGLIGWDDTVSLVNSFFNQAEVFRIALLKQLKTQKELDTEAFHKSLKEIQAIEEVTVRMAMFLGEGFFTTK